MGGLSGVGGSTSAQDTRSTDKLDDVKAQNRADQAALDAQLNQQAKGPSSEQMAAFIAQIQAAQAAQTQGSGGGNPVDNMPPELRVQAKAISAQVMNQIMGQMPSAQSAPSPSSSGDTSSGGEQSANAGTSGALGTSSSQENAADQQIQQAAKVAVYDDIYKLLNKMQNTRNTKADLDEKSHAIDIALQGKKPGDKVRVPDYEYDTETGKVKSNGVKEMSYEDAQAMKGRLNDSKDSLNELNQEDMFWMQRLMEQKSQLESMISNVMKANSDTQGQLSSNLK